MENFSIKQINKGLREKEFSAVELADFFLKQIKEKDQKISAFVSILEDNAKKSAQEVDKIISEGKEISSMAGVPMAIKDNIMIRGERCSCSSKILENYKASYNATCIKKLKKSGAIFLGKTNLDEFAMGASTENSAFFKTKNPNDLERVPGGSSGGSAAAVAAKMCSGALGSDTGGSIRQPASFCGVVGLKPTYGAVSRYGLVAYASSFDQIGPIAKTAEDAEIIFDAISGIDEMDSTSVDAKFQISNFNPKNLTVGIPKEYFAKGIDKKVEESVKNQIKKIEDAGTKIKEINLPHTEYALAIYYLIATSEASSNLARFDGIKYGFSAGNQEAGNLMDVYLKSRGGGFGKEVKRRILLGTYALSSGYYDAYYLKAQKARTLLKDDFKKAFKSVDFILSPVSPMPPFKLGEKIDDPLQMYLADVYTVSANLVGIPALSLPIKGAKGELPVGLQIMGKPFSEKDIFALANFIEKEL
jgi:aspartyl-tRNA(Asn)/glutamyl-tRNA(Gln) amidotransferase subunit A